MTEKHNKQKNRRMFALVTYGIVLYMVLQNFKSIRSVFAWIFAIIEPVAYGICIAFVINLVMKLFRRKVFRKLADSEKPWVNKLCTVCCALSTLLVAAGMVAMLIFLIIPQISTAINTLIEKIPSSQEQLTAVIDAKLTAWNAPQFIVDKYHELDVDWETAFKYLTNFADGKIKIESVLGTAFQATTSVLSAATNFLLGVIIAIYILLQKERVLYVFHKMIELFVPQRYQKQTFRILHMTNQSFANFLTGQFIEALINGSLCTVGLTIFGFPFAATIGVLTGLTALLPIIGAWIGGGIGLLLVWVVAPERAIWFIVFIVILQQLDGQLIYPKIVGDSVGLPGLLVLIAVILGGGFGGIPGILFAVPLFTILYALLKEAIDKLPKEQPVPPADPEPEAQEPDAGSTSEVVPVSAPADTASTDK